MTIVPVFSLLTVVVRAVLLGALFVAVGVPVLAVPAAFIARPFGVDAGKGLMSSYNSISWLARANKRNRQFPSNNLSMRFYGTGSRPTELIAGSD